MTDTLKLRLETDGFPAQDLALSPEAPQTDEEALGRIRRRAWADRAVRFSLPAEGLENNAITLRLNGTTVQTSAIRLDGHENRLVMEPIEPRVFEDTCGVGRLSVVLIRRGTGERTELFAEPLLVRFPEGPVTENILAMANEVVGRWGEIFTRETAGGKAGLPGDGLPADEELKGRLAFLAELGFLFESQLAALTTRGKRVVGTERRLEPFERVRKMDVRTFRYICTHPEELAESTKGAGFQIERGFYLPRRVPVEHEICSFDTPENRMAAGLAEAVLKALTNERQRLTEVAAQLPDEEEAADGYRAPGLAVVLEAKARLVQAAEKLAPHERHFRSIAERLRTAFGFRAQALTRVPLPSAAATTDPAYRVLFTAARRWFGRTDPAFEAEAALIFAMERSALYEYFVFFRLLDALRELGFTVTGAERFRWTGAGERFTQTEHENTVRLVRGTTKITLYMQPVIAGQRYTGENGLFLKRSTSKSMRFDESGSLVLEERSTAFFTPDFVMKTEFEGSEGAVYALLDAKLSSARSVMRHQMPFLAWKYLIGVRTVRPEDRLQGLWLLCGHPNVRDAEAGSRLFDLADGLCEAPDIHLFTLTARPKGSLSHIAAELLKDAQGPL